MGPVSGTGRAMMASLQQAMQQGMPTDQAIAYVKSMAQQGVAPLTDLYAMLNQFQRLKQPQAQAPQTPPTIKDQINMAAQQRAAQDAMMGQGLGAVNAGSMENPQFAGGGIVAFSDGGGTSLAQRRSILARQIQLAKEEGATPEQIRELEAQLARESLITPAGTLSEGAFRQQTAGMGITPTMEMPKVTATEPDFTIPLTDSSAGATADPTGFGAELAKAKKDSFGRDVKQDAGSVVPPRRRSEPSADALPRAAATGNGLSPFLRMIQEAEKAQGIGEASTKARKMIEDEAAQEAKLTPEQKRLALAKAGFQMAEAYSRRGRQRVSGLGGVAEAGKAYSESMESINKSLQDAAKGRRKDLIMLEQADELARRGQIQSALQLKRDAENDAFKRTELATRQVEARLDRDLRQRLGDQTAAVTMAGIDERAKAAIMGIKQKAIADFSEYVGNLSFNSEFNELSKEEQNVFVTNAYERMVNSVVGSLSGGGRGPATGTSAYPGFSLVGTSR